MILHVTGAKYVRERTVWLQFSDGAAGEVDLASELDGEVFEPLRNPETFKRFSLRFHTLSWDNGADFAPEFLREKLAQPISAPQLAPAAGR